MALHYIIIIVAVIIIIILQVTSLIGTLKRMKFYSRIFGEKKAFEYSLVVDSTGRTNGFAVESGSNDNPYFNRINSSINNYVKNNESIDFQLLKDTVDANCDSVEEDIHTQIPIPLYLGLAGTMLGIIVGVGYLWVSGDLDSLLSVNKNAQATNNTEGIVVLLGGVAIAMICSIVGLSMTTYCTYRFKGCRLTIEQRKSDLYTWLQQHLLPEVATDDLQAIGKISRSLQNFNTTFKQHTDAFAKTLASVQTIMSQQRELAKSVAQMGQDANAMASANAIAASRLEQSGEKLGQFADYLDSINGYVDEVHKFTENFKEENLRLGALEEIRDFFLNEKKEIERRNNSMSAKVGKFDDAFQKAMQDLRASMAEENKELQKLVGQRTVAFEEGINEQKKLFDTANQEILAEFKQQINTLPQAVHAINSLQNLPSQIQALVDNVDSSNKDMIKQLKNALPSVVIQGDNNSGYSHGQPVIPSWLKWLIAICVVIITFANIFNSCNTWQMNNKPIPTVTNENYLPADSVIEDTTTNM